MGKLLYNRLGFQELASVVVQVDCKDEKISVDVMVYNPNCTSTSVRKIS